MPPQGFTTCVACSGSGKVQNIPCDQCAGSGLVGNGSNESGPPAPKNPMAAALNLIPLPFALGYAYLGRWQRFFWAIVLRVVAALIGSFFALWRLFVCQMNGDCTLRDNFEAWVLFLAFPGAVAVFSALDAYGVARSDNESTLGQTSPPDQSTPLTPARTCDLCGGSGMTSPVYKCNKCNGSGTVRE